ncbi:diaminopropionate ammonia-lyase [Anoxybacterium hadale]|uniref:Diaminopropionate ammonia-lyase n=1 Tax=Anoxybacterium hadale TaxID=3408580 RepID=A0ACD1AE98_9FIRM|nr:diaminopropionate ammonia-lyase [Clostridiales bacterium]
MDITESKLGIRLLANEQCCDTNFPDFLSEANVSHIRRFHETVPDYRSTPLVCLDALASHLGVGKIYIKDESKRFGLNAFKSLGGLYAVTRVICRELDLDIKQVTFPQLQTPDVKQKISNMVFITATDGNHGRGIAWAASRYGCKSYIYMTKGTAQSRVDAVYAAGAEEVIVTEVNYDDTVKLAAKRAEDCGWTLVQDTAWEGYEEIPSWITQGYTTMGAEMLEQLGLEGIQKPSHLFLQSGVGSFAGGILGYYACRFDGKPPITTIVEPVNVACVMESALAADGNPHAVAGIQETIMAGLNCGDPCLTTWHILRDWSSFFAACPDFVTAKGMRTLANPLGKDPKIISGESGAVGLGLLSLLMERSELAGMRTQMGIDQHSVILLVSTEGDTDPTGYREVIYDGKCPVPQ